MNLTLAICSIQEEKEDALICVSATHVSLICTQKRWRRKEVKKIMKKKLLALIMTACMVTTMFTACGKADSSAASETEGQNWSYVKI